MNPKKKDSAKSRNAGISLAPELKSRAKDLAGRLGFKNLSALAHKLITDALNEAADKAESTGEKLKQRGERKLRKSREK